MNRRSFLLGLATVPVAGLTVASPPVVKQKEFIKTVTIRFDRTLVDKRYGMSPLGDRIQYANELAQECRDRWQNLNERRSEMGNLGEALKQAGISPAMAELRVAHSKFINQGGTTAQIRAEADAIDRMSGMGQRAHADHSQDQVAQTRQQVEGGEARRGVSQDQCAYAPPPSSNHDELGHHTRADQRQSVTAELRRVPDRGGEGHAPDARKHPLSLAQPVREPSRTERGISSIKLVQSTIQKGLLELRKTADGKAWGSVCWHELEGMDRDGSIARLIKAGVNPPKNQHAELRSFLSNKQFEEICNAAKKQNDFV